MRVALLLLALVAAGAAGWWLLRAPAPDAALDGLAPAVEPQAPAPVRPLEAPAPALAEAPAPVAVPRIGVVTPGEGRPPVDPEAPPWETCVVRPVRAPGQRLSGAALLEALATRLYVRVRRAADLEALRALQLEVEQDELPIATLLHLLEAQGWKATVLEPRVMLYPLGEGERREPRALPGEAPR